MKCKITWLTQEEGGRAQPPPISSSYYCTITLSDKSSWSCCIFDRKPLDNLNEIASIQFLISNTNLLFDNNFFLIEGAKQVAFVERMEN